MESEMTDKQAIKRLVGILVKYKLKICIIIFALVFSTALNFCIPLFSRRIMDDGFIGGNRQLLVKLSLASFLYLCLLL